MNGVRQCLGELLDEHAERDAHRRQWRTPVSHDMRTPRTALMACFDCADQVLEDDPEQLPAEMRRLLQTARLDDQRVCVLARRDTEDCLEVVPVPPAELVFNARDELQALGVDHAAGSVQVSVVRAPVRSSTSRSATTDLGLPTEDGTVWFRLPVGGPLCQRA